MKGRGRIQLAVKALRSAAALIVFWRVQALAGALLVPYLLWVC